MTTKAKIESILFVASKPVSTKMLAKVLSVSVEEVRETLQTLATHYNIAESGIHILISADDVQMVTNNNFSDLVDQFTKSEILGELTPAQLETLTVVAYRQPVTRPEIEQIRGVNCAVILRNLMQRGLVEEEDSKDSVVPVYRLSINALRHLGVTKVQELPNFSEFHEHAHLDPAKDSDE